MAQHIDTVNHNVYYDGVTLTNCTYVRCKEGCTGTIVNTRYADIGANNSLSISDSSYIKIGDNNTDIRITSGQYIIVGTENNSVSVGTQRNPDSPVSRTGASSVSVSKRVVGVDITGSNMRLWKTKYSEIDGICNEIENSGSVIILESTGNRLNKCDTVELVQTNNNTVEADNMSLEIKDPFMSYTRFHNEIRAASTAERVNRQSDSLGVILDTQLNELINKDSGKDKTMYTKVGGVWTVVQKNV